ncbi:DUF2474 family protein [Aquidulcibacter sp.]
MSKSLKQLFWFALIWTGSVATLTLVSFLIRTLVR